MVKEWGRAVCRTGVSSEPGRKRSVLGRGREGEKQKVRSLKRIYSRFGTWWKMCGDHPRGSQFGSIQARAKEVEQEHERGSYAAVISMQEDEEDIRRCVTGKGRGGGHHH